MLVGLGSWLLVGSEATDITSSSFDNPSQRVKFSNCSNNSTTSKYWLSIYVSVTKATARAVRGS